MSTLPTFSIRPAAIDDLDLLVEIEKRVHPAPWTKEHFAAELEKPYAKLWVMTDDETDSIIAGYISLWMLDDSLQILNVAVDLKFRGLGFAQVLIRKAIDEALREEMKRIHLEVRKSNTAAIALYQKLGFDTVQVRKGFYSNGEDAYIMDLILNIANLQGSS